MKEISLLGHKSRCFDIKHDDEYSAFVSASEDGNAIIWSTETNKLVHRLVHNKEAEVLRAGFCDFRGKSVYTCGADGKVYIWDCNDKCDKIQTLDHGDRQIYGFEQLKSQENVGITAADELVCLWDINEGKVLSSFGFGQDTSSVGYGGPRNPDLLVYVFDLKVSPTNSSVVMTACSDSRVAIVDIRESSRPAITNVYQLPAHPTGVRQLRILLVVVIN